jgi:hypothetical protein
VLSNRAKESWAYGYDPLDRLILADNLDDDALDQSFAYDGVGNMTFNSALGSYAYPPSGPTAARPHAPLSAGPRSYGGACPRA